MWENKFNKEGLTFDDVLLLPQESTVLPSDVKVEVSLTDTLNLKIPIMSAGRIQLLNQAWQSLWLDKAGLVLSIKICRLKNRQNKWTK